MRISGGTDFHDFPSLPAQLSVHTMRVSHVPMRSDVSRAGANAVHRKRKTE
jgi:hypothetical protein